jgi:TRAP-type mannitol/chloroaromatic compound transport system permease small subunit
MAAWPAGLVRLVGRSVAWLTLAMVLTTFVMVSLRYGMNMGWAWLQESITYMHAAVFMLAIAWALQVDAHVRVDIFYRNASPRRKAITNLAGTVLFLLPFCLFLVIVAWDYVAASWGLLEGSREAGGLPFVYLLKSLIIAMPVLLLLQALDNAWRDIQLLRAPAP